MLLTIAASQFRRTRIHSLKGLVLAVIAALALYAPQTFFEEKLGWNTKKSRTVAGSILFAVVVIIMIAFVAAQSES